MVLVHKLLAAVHFMSTVVAISKDFWILHFAPFSRIKIKTTWKSQVYGLVHLVKSYQTVQLCVLSQQYAGWDFWWIGRWGRMPGHREPGAGRDRHRDLRKGEVFSLCLHCWMDSSPAALLSRWLDSGCACDYCRPFFTFMRFTIIGSDCSRCVLPLAKM